MEPENTTLEKEKHIQTTNFWVQNVTFRGCTLLYMFKTQDMHFSHLSGCKYQLSSMMSLPMAPMNHSVFPMGFPVVASFWGWQFLRTRFCRWLELESLFIIELLGKLLPDLLMLFIHLPFSWKWSPFFRWSRHQCLEMQRLRRDDVDSRRGVVASCKATSVELVVMNRSYKYHVL